MPQVILFSMFFKKVEKIYIEIYSLKERYSKMEIELRNESQLERIRKPPILLSQEESLAEKVKKQPCLFDKSQKMYKERDVVKMHGKPQYLNYTLLKMVCNLLQNLYHEQPIQKKYLSSGFLKECNFRNFQNILKKTFATITRITVQMNKISKNSLLYRTESSKNLLYFV